MKEPNPVPFHFAPKGPQSNNTNRAPTTGNTRRGDTTIPAVVEKQIRYFINGLGLDWDTSRDLYQEAEVAIWRASTRRVTYRSARQYRSYLILTGVGAIRHWLRDQFSLIRIPCNIQESGQTALHAKTIVPLDNVSEPSNVGFEAEVLDRIYQRTTIERFLPRLTPAERFVMRALLQGHTISEIARQRQVQELVIYAQRLTAIKKLRRLVAKVPAPSGLDN